jgi:DNA-3-methyladenine glycosylase
MKLSKDFYLEKDVVGLSRKLLGKVLYTSIQGKYTAGIITETEAYNGITDKASHAYGGRRTKRTEIMFERGGLAYVYLCYGIHHLFNVVSNTENNPHAILIRAIQPVEGIPDILRRRNMTELNTQICNGPGKVSQALGINLSHNKTDLTKNTIWIEDQNIVIAEDKINIGPRIGVDYAEEDAKKPYRFWIK